MLRRLFATVAVAGLLGACGGQTGNSALAAVTLAAAKTSDAGTARFATDMTMTMQGQTVSGSGTGELDLERQLTHMTTSMSGLPGGQTIDSEIYSSGFAIYMRSDSFGVPMPGVKDWIEMDLQAVGEKLGFDLGAFQQLGQNDPTASLDYLRGTKSVEAIGTEEIRGTNTTHYRAVVEWDSVVQEVPEDSRAAMQKNIDLIKEWTGEEEMNLDVWLDEEGRMRRQAMEFTYAEGPAAGTTMDMTIEMFDFGVDVEIQLPDPSDVTSFEELMGELQPSG